MLGLKVVYRWGMRSDENSNRPGWRAWLGASILTIFGILVMLLVVWVVIGSILI